MLEIQHLSAGYPGKEVLRDVSLCFPEGCLTVILGPNGCGKSTLLKAIAGIIPGSGSIRFRDIQLSALSAGDRARQLAFLPQVRPLPEISAGKLVLHGRFPYLGYPRRYRTSDKAIALDAMDQLGIRHLEHRELSTLSGGERQKVYIAMLLAQGTPIVLMDEPTTYLDIAHKFEVMDIARQLTRQGKTVILVLHDLDLAMAYADRILLMDDGRPVFSGTPEALYASGQLQKVFRIRMGCSETEGQLRYFFQPQP